MRKAPDNLHAHSGVVDNGPPCFLARAMYNRRSMHTDADGGYCYYDNIKTITMSTTNIVKFDDDINDDDDDDDDDDIVSMHKILQVKAAGCMLVASGAGWNGLQRFNKTPSLTRRIMSTCVV